MMKVAIAAAILVLAFAGTAAAAQLNTIKGTRDNDITPKPKRMLPDCGNPAPCDADLKGTDGADAIYGLGGWDWVAARDGNDVIYGGVAMDQLYGGDGSDRLYGGTGHDHLFGDDGSDYLDASDGRDEHGHVEAVFGDRVLRGEHGNDTCVVDEDPADGIVVGSCETLIIKSVPGLDGSTPWGKTQEGVMSGREVSGRLTPGTYHNIG